MMTTLNMTTTESDKLTPFETYMLADDSPEYPMTFFLRLRFRGRLRKPALDAAFREVVRRHPLLHATVRIDGAFRARWLIHHDRYPSILPHSLGEPLKSGALPHIDLTREFGVRSWFATGNNETEIWFQFHHACVDAVAAIELLDEVLTQYRFGSEASRFDWSPEEETARLRDRRSYGSFRRPPRFSWPAHCARTLRFFRNRPRQLPGAAEPTTTGARLPAALAQEIAISPRSRSGGPSDVEVRATVNDRMLVAVFAVLGRWCRRHGLGDDDCLRIAVPVDLRGGPRPEMTGSNCVSMVFIDRSLGATTSSSRLLRGIAAETARIKSEQSAAAMLRALAVITRLPGGMRRVLRLQQCPTTTVLSNLGIVLAGSACADQDGRLRVDDAVLDSIDFLPPVRRGVIAVFGVLTYAGRLSCCMHYDPRLLAPPKAVQLFEDFIEDVPRHLELDVGAVPCG